MIISSKLHWKMSKIIQMEATQAIPTRVLFIHIPKCAGVAIFFALEKLVDLVRLGPHSKAVDIFDLHKQYNNTEYFVFTFVRNPWDRLVSTFFYFMRAGRAPIDQRRRDTILKKYNGRFKEFVLDIENWINLKEDDSIYPDRYIPHFRPQYEYIYDKDGNCLVDFIGKVETLDKDFEKLCKILSLNNASLKRKNKTSHKKYFKYYDNETRDIVAHYYEKDIELFNYQFRQPQSGLSPLFSNMISRFL